MSRNIKKIFEKLDHLKRENFLSDSDIADAMKVTPSAYSRLKNKQRRITVEYLDQIASFFKVPLFYLFFTQGDLNELCIGDRIVKYMSVNQLKEDELAEIMNINSIRIKELCRGGIPTKKEVEKLKTVISIGLSEENLVDGRLELMKLVLKEYGLAESKIRVIMEYIEEHGV